jgi:hypothetical protein
MARQARRSMRSRSASSISSLSSLSTLSASVCSISSVGSISSPDTQACGSGHEAKAHVVVGLFSQGESSSSLGKRKRVRNAEKEGERRSKRQRANPRKRWLSEKERKGRSKLRQGVDRAFQSSIPYQKLCRSRKVKQESKVWDIEAVKAKGVRVVKWDGMWVRLCGFFGCQLMFPLSSPMSIWSDDGALIVHLAGRPKDPKYPETLCSFEGGLDGAGGRFHFTGRLGENRRGNYRAISTGITHGGGSKVCF